MIKNTEFGFIEHIKSLFSAMGEQTLEGIGDDCAVIPVSDDESLVLTTDLLSEGVHFLFGAISAYDLGRKSLAVNLSDVASMGAKPLASMLSIALPTACTGEWAEQFMAGYASLSDEYNVKLIGGDTSKSLDKIMINVVAIGRVNNKHIKRRADAKVGDKIYVLGKLGASACGLKDILQGDYNTQFAKVHNSPRAQVEEGIYLGSCPGVNAMIDLSDGLASDLTHILELSGVDALINLDKLDYEGSFENAVCAGEDYKLLFTASNDDFIKDYTGETLHEIGEITALKGSKPKITWLLDKQEQQNTWKGYTHF